MLRTSAPSSNPSKSSAMLSNVLFTALPITIETEGDDAEAALQAIQELIADKFGEGE